MSSRFVTSIKTTATAICITLLIVMAAIAPASAQVPSGIAVGFDQLGFIQSATINPSNGTDILAGGTIKVNDITITVPRNTILQMPAATLSWGKCFQRIPWGAQLFRAPRAQVWQWKTARAPVVRVAWLGLTKRTYKATF